MKHIKELDSVRAIAVFLVIICHWVKTNDYITDSRLGLFGSLGVDTFFVLSGFLITGILLREKRKAESQGIPLRIIYKHFYARRALRIFPVFYLTVGLLFLASFYNSDITRTELLFSATYTVNFYIHRIREWSGYTAHFWSLAVEEQFYLLWPMLMLQVKTKYLPDVMIVFAAIAVTAQVIQNDEFGRVTTFACFDAFAAGAAFSWLLDYRKDLIPFFFRIIRVLAAGSFLIILMQFLKSEPYAIPESPPNVLVALYLIMIIVLHNDPPVKYPLRWLFDNKFLIFAGRISYGLYVYHLYMPSIGNFILKKLIGKQFKEEEIATDNILFFAFNLALLFLISYISYVVMEKPILRLKRYFVTAGMR